MLGFTFKNTDGKRKGFNPAAILKAFRSVNANSEDLDKNQKLFGREDERHDNDAPSQP